MPGPARQEERSDEPRLRTAWRSRLGLGNSRGLGLSNSRGLGLSNSRGLALGNSLLAVIDGVVLAPSIEGFSGPVVGEPVHSLSGSILFVPPGRQRGEFGAGVFDVQVRQIDQA